MGFLELGSLFVAANITMKHIPLTPGNKIGHVSKIEPNVYTLRLESYNIEVYKKL